MDVGPRRLVRKDMRESVVTLRESSLDVHKRAAVPGDGAHDVLPLVAFVGVSKFDVSKAANARRRVTHDLCKSGSGMRELAHDLGLQVETLRESPPGMGERGDVRSESPQAVYEGAQVLYSVVRGRLRGRRGDEGAGTGRRQGSPVPGEARRGPRPAGETSPGREHRAFTRSQRRGASFHRSCARESRSGARFLRSSPSR